MIDGKVLTDKNGNPVMYEVRLNEDTFNYVLGRNLFTQAGQLQLLKGGPPVSFPTPAMEIKASWRFLGSGDDPTHYLTAAVNFGGAQRIVGLNGLHISSKALPQWIWCTFEQIENPQTTGVTMKLPIAPAVQQKIRTRKPSSPGRNGPTTGSTEYRPRMQTIAMRQTASWIPNTVAWPTRKLKPISRAVLPA